MKRIKDMVILGLVALVIIMGFEKAKVFKSLETQELVIRGENNSSHIKIDGKGEFPQICLINNEGKVLASLSMEDQKTPLLSINDQREAQRITVRGGSVPGIFLKNDQNRVIGSWSLLKDGGAGFGLAYSSGIASTILRGGNNPTLAFFTDGMDPTASFGVSKEIPHMRVAGKSDQESLLLHGGENPGLMVLDEQGQLKIYISKQGYMRGQEKAPEGVQEKRKLFTWDEDNSRLFPDQSEESLH